MARFTTTIQLHNAEESDYNVLHAGLAKASFKGGKSSPQEVNKLPGRREYTRGGNVTIQQVTDAVLKAAASTGKQYSFTIVRDKPVYN